LPAHRRLIDGLPASAVASDLGDLRVLFQATCAVARFALNQGQPPEEVRSGLLDGARKSERFFNRYTHETAVAVIQRAIDAAIAESCAASSAEGGKLRSWSSETDP
jgi:hypothetical protein